jgi:phosphate:Na+ symporter
VELGLELTDMVTSLERIAKHCSNIAEEQTASETDQYAFHQYARNVKERNQLYKELLEGYTEKYSLEKT